MKKFNGMMMKLVEMIKKMVQSKKMLAGVVAGAALFVVIVMSLVCSSKRPQIIVAGHNNSFITIVDKKSGEIVWRYNLVKGEQCNSIAMREKGKQVIFTTQVGAQIVDIETKEAVWKYSLAENKIKGEVHSVATLKNGGFVLFIAANPARIVEFSPEFEVVNDTMFDGGTTNIHTQFRQATIAQNGNYLIPMMSQRRVVELNSQGEEVARYQLERPVFGVKEARNGNLLMGHCDTHIFSMYDPKSKSTVMEFEQMKGEDVTLLFMAQVEQIGCNRYMVANWSGHNKKKLAVPAPQLIEFNSKGEIKWMWVDGEQKLGRVSSFYYSDKPIVK